MPLVDYYNVLGVEIEATEETIQKLYFAKCELIYSLKPFKVNALKELNIAYDVLSNLEKKQKYDASYYHDCWHQLLDLSNQARSDQNNRLNNALLTDIQNIAPEAALRALNTIYRQLTPKFHPDKGGDLSQWDTIQKIRLFLLSENKLKTYQASTQTLYSESDLKEENMVLESMPIKNSSGNYSEYLNALEINQYLLPLTLNEYEKEYHTLKTICDTREGKLFKPGNISRKHAFENFAKKISDTFIKEPRYSKYIHPYLSDTQKNILKESTHNFEKIVPLSIEVFTILETHVTYLQHWIKFNKDFLGENYIAFEDEPIWKKFNTLNTFLDSIIKTLELKCLDAPYSEDSNIQNLINSSLLSLEKIKKLKRAIIDCEKAYILKSTRELCIDYKEIIVEHINCPDKIDELKEFSKKTKTVILKKIQPFITEHQSILKSLTHNPEFFKKLDTHENYESIVAQYYKIHCLKFIEEQQSSSVLDTKISDFLEAQYKAIQNTFLTQIREIYFNWKEKQETLEKIFQESACFSFYFPETFSTSLSDFITEITQSLKEYVANFLNEYQEISQGFNKETNGYQKIQEYIQFVLEKINTPLNFLELWTSLEKIIEKHPFIKKLITSGSISEINSKIKKLFQDMTPAEVEKLCDSMTQPPPKLSTPFTGLFTHHPLLPTKSNRETIEEKLNSYIQEIEDIKNPDGTINFSPGFGYSIQSTQSREIRYEIAKVLLFEIKAFEKTLVNIMSQANIDNIKKIILARDQYKEVEYKEPTQSKLYKIIQEAHKYSNSQSPTASRTMSTALKGLRSSSSST